MSPSNQLNDLTPKTWAQYSASVLTGFSTLETILERFFRIYTKEGNKILGHPNFGGDLKGICDYTTREMLDQKVDNIQDEEVVLAVGESLTFNPTDFEKYQVYCQEIEDWISEIYPKLKTGHYLLWLVKDIRLHHYLIPFHEDIAQMGIKQGLKYHDLWVWDRSDQTKNMNSISHSYVVVLRKLSPKAASSNKRGLGSLNQCGKDRKEIFSSTTNLLPFTPKYSTTVVRDFSSPRRQEYRQHGATFPQALIEYLVKIFTHPGGTVLDIFAGTGISLQASEALSRRSIGIELNPKYFSMARNLLGLNLKALEISPNITIDRPNKPKLIHDDCRHLNKHINAESIDLMVTSPPYANILHKVAKEAQNRGDGSVFRRRKQSPIKRVSKDLTSFFEVHQEGEKEILNDPVPDQISGIPHPYSGDDKDLGNIVDYNLFLDEITGLHTKIFDVLKPGSFAIWIVRDFRNVSQGRYFIPYHCDLAVKASEVGYEYYDLWVWDQTKGRRIIHLGGGTAYYNSLTHSMIVILRKPKK